MDDPLRLKRLIDVGRGVLAPLELEEVLESVAEAAREITGARYAALGVLAPDRGELVSFVHSGMDPETARRIGATPRGRGVLGELTRNPVPLRLADVSSHPRSFGFPPHHPPMASFLGVPILVRGEAYGNLYMAEKDGAAEFGPDDEEAAETLAAWAGIAIEHARVYADLSRREVELARALRQVEASMDITEALDSETDLTRILELIAKRARALVEAATVAVYLRRGERLVMAACTGGRARRVAHPLEGTELGATVRTLAARRLSGEPAAPEHGLREQLGAEEALLIPLQSHGTGLGVLVACDRAPGGPGFDEEDTRLLRAFASSASTAVETAQKVEQQRLRDRIEASELERHHWAHELHDETLQQLAAIRIRLAAALRSREDDPAAVARAAQDAVDGMEREITALSRLIGELRPIPLETLGLDRALESLAEESAERGSFRVETEISLRSDFPADHERAIYRLVQESLNNVVKHAGASRVRVEAAPDDGSVRLVVEDDGDGFDVDATPAGVGLNGMRERIELLGGSLEMRSEPGAGTTVVARVPAGGAEDAV
ncbi:MAG: GAF domain-containing sensor histidine kinase [Solirubrobacterales bacterium]